MKANSRATALASYLMFGDAASGRAEDFVPLYKALGCGGLLSVFLGLFSTSWIAEKSGRKWIWFLLPGFVAAWAIVFLAAFSMYSAF